VKVAAGATALPPVTVVLTGEEAVQLWKELVSGLPMAEMTLRFRDHLGDAVRPLTAIYRLPTESET
jgi:hypothetical protein